MLFLRHMNEQIHEKTDLLSVGLHTALISPQYQCLFSQQLLKQEAVQQVLRRESGSSLLSNASCSSGLLLTTAHSQSSCHATVAEAASSHMQGRAAA